MLIGNALIGLREGLEAALVVTVLVTFLVRTGRRSSLPVVWAGAGSAVLLSVLAGGLVAYTYASLGHEQQEAFGGITSVVAVGFVTWMIFWMRRAAKALSGQLREQLAGALDIGPLAVATVAFLAVAREGLETALMFFAGVQSATGGAALPLAGLLAGLAAATALGYLIYRGAVRINLSRFFGITGVLLIVVAAGFLAYGVHDLQEAHLVPGLHTLAFDVSDYVSIDSWYGALLKGIFNFSPRTTAFEAVAWTGYVAVVLTLFLMPRQARHPAHV